MKFLLISFLFSFLSFAQAADKIELYSSYDVAESINGAQIEKCHTLGDIENLVTVLDHRRIAHKNKLSIAIVVICNINIKTLFVSGLEVREENIYQDEKLVGNLNGSITLNSLEMDDSVTSEKNKVDLVIASAKNGYNVRLDYSEDEKIITYFATAQLDID